MDEVSKGRQRAILELIQKKKEIEKKKAEKESTATSAQQTVQKGTDEYWGLAETESTATSAQQTVQKGSDEYWKLEFFKLKAKYSGQITCLCGFPGCSIT